MKLATQLLLAIGTLALHAAEPATTNTMTTTPSQTNKTELATLGGGCFWCTEVMYERVPGVISVVSGYAGGHTENPDYKSVVTGETGHAEVIQIEFDPAVVSYEKLLELFWDAHDPTTRNQQGNDVGTQYRSIILFHNDAQKEVAKKSLAAASVRFEKPITTQVVPLTKFYKAEAYHQDYFKNNPQQPYCRYVIEPKLDKFEKKLKKTAK